MDKSESPVILCQDLGKSFGAGPVLQGVNLALSPGEVLALVGPSGSGKTTLLRLMAGFEMPDEGRVALEGKTVAGAGKWVPPEARRLGMVFQDYALFPHMTVVQNVAFGLEAWARSERQRRARATLEIVRMDHLAERYPAQLSGGEQQRVALARSLAPQPLALLLDEPFSNLDPELRLQLRSEVRAILRSGGVSAVYVTHDQDDAMFMGDRVAVLKSGSLEQVGAPEEIFHHPRTRFVARFLGTADFLPGRATDTGLATEIGVLKPQAPLAAPLAEGAQVEVMVRPDDVSIYPAPGGPGRIVSRLFRGMHYLYVVSLPSGAQVHSLQHHSTYMSQGAAVEVRLEPNQTLTCFVGGVSSQGRDLGEPFSAVTCEDRDARALEGG